MEGRRAGASLLRVLGSACPGSLSPVASMVIRHGEQSSLPVRGISSLLEVGGSWEWDGDGEPSLSVLHRPMPGKAFLETWPSSLTFSWRTGILLLY